MSTCNCYSVNQPQRKHFLVSLSISCFTVEDFYLVNKKTMNIKHKHCFVRNDFIIDTDRVSSRVARGNCFQPIMLIVHRSLSLLCLLNTDSHKSLY